ncbi:MAG: OmpA family protein [Alphaproteobacteria bacterium]|nr:OmpA family protein [Alphaproteobacteria bacterium]
MKIQSGASVWVITRVLACAAAFAVAGCATSNVDSEYSDGYVATPTVDYVERLDVYSAPHKDSFLNQLAMNYRSYAIYNARTSGHPDVGELFANKAVSAFAGEVPFPESLNNWEIANDNTAYELSMAYNDMIEQFRNDASDTHPELAAELQAKYDCWISAVATGQDKTARECRARFERTLTALRDCRGGKIVNNPSRMTTETTTTTSEMVVSAAEQPRVSVPAYYPETGNMAAMRGANRTREGVIIVNNVNVPEHLINPVPVESQQPLVFNQNIYGGDKTFNDNSKRDSENTNLKADCPCANRESGTAQPMVMSNNQPVSVTVNGAPTVLAQPVPAPVEPCECAGEDVEEITIVADDLVSRQEFINMMMAMRAELAAINARLDKLSAGQPKADDYDETTIIKVQQIPLEPKQHVMEEVFEIRFDFDKAKIKPEYDDVIRKLATVTQNNKNVKISVVGHTDTSGSKSYNYALGGRRAEAVQKMLIERGIPSSQIVAVSAGEEDLKVWTPDGVPNAENRRVRVVKEVTYTDPNGGKMVPVANVAVEEFVEDCDGAACGM